MSSPPSSKASTAIPSPVTDSRTKKQPIPAWRKWTAAALLAFVVVPFLHDNLAAETSVVSALGAREVVDGAKCPAQPRALVPRIPFEWDEAYKAHSAKLLSRAVVSTWTASDEDVRLSRLRSKSRRYRTMIWANRTRISGGIRSLSSNSGS